MDTCIQLFDSIRTCFYLYYFQILRISPQNIDDTMLHLITESKLKHLHIVQNGNTPKTVMPCSAKAWTHFKRHASEYLQVHLEANSNGTNECELLIQPDAPIHSITCKNVIQFTKQEMDFK